MKTDILQMTHTSLLLSSVPLKPALSHVEENVFAQKAMLPSLRALAVIPNPLHHQHGYICCDGAHKISGLSR